MQSAGRPFWGTSLTMVPLYAAAMVAVVGFPYLPVAVGGASLQAVLSAPDATEGDAFGDSVAIGREWLAVGSPGKDDAGSDSGAVYVFRRDGTGWACAAKLTASDAAAGDHFGKAVSIDGGVLVVGAWGDDDAGEGSGAAYVFGWDGSDWRQQAKLTASDAAAGDSFGYAVSVSGDSLAVGAYANCDAGLSSGSVYVFEPAGESWGEQVKLTPADAKPRQYFGWSVGLDGDRLAAGARGDDDVGKNAGAAYVFARDGGDWVEAAKLTASDTSPGDKLGSSVAVSGERAVASAPGADPTGAAYAVCEAGPSWAQQAKLTVGGAVEADAFGCDVAIDGGEIVVGAPGDDEAAADAGAAYVFARHADTWLPAAKLLPAGEAAGRRMGCSVAVCDGCVAAGAVGDVEAGELGAAYVYSTGTRTVWRGPNGSGGRWADANQWTAGVPAGGVDVTVGNGSTAALHDEAASARDVAVGAVEPGALTLEDSTLALRDLTIGAYGSLQADANSTIRLGGDLICGGRGAAGADLSGSTVLLPPQTPAGGPQLLELAGPDLGLDPAGWCEGFVIGSLVVGSGATLRLVDGCDNDPNCAAPEAVYVGELVLEPGARIHLNGGALYFGNGGVPKRLLPGDLDLDGDVDADDVLILEAHFEATGPVGWLEGDADGDGQVGPSDYLALKAHLGSISRGQPMHVPEPAALSMLLAGAALLPRLRRRGG